MNQILVIGNKNGKNNSTTDIKKIVLFFAVAIIIFGVIMVVKGIVGLNKDKNENNSQSPVATQTETPTTSNPISYDEEPPTIELKLSGSTVKIIARDETEIDYIEYGWNDEEKQIVSNTNDKNRIDASIEIKNGINTLNVKAVDKAGNIQTNEQDFEGQVEPEVELFVTEDQQGLLIIATCEDGISKIEFTQNGNWNRLQISDTDYTAEQWASINVKLEYSDDGKVTKVEYIYKNLVEGENKFSVYAYSLKGLVGGSSGTCTYTPPAQ